MFSKLKKSNRFSKLDIDTKHIKNTINSTYKDNLLCGFAAYCDITWSEIEIHVIHLNSTSFIAIIKFQKDMEMVLISGPVDIYIYKTELINYS